MSLSIVTSKTGTMLIRYQSYMLSLENTPMANKKKCVPFSHYKRGIFLFFSPLFGQGCKEFLQNILKYNLVLLCEKECVLHNLLKDSRSDFYPYLKHPHVILVKKESPQEIFDRCKPYMDTLQLNKVIALSLSKAYRMHAFYYKTTKQFIEKSIHIYWHNRATTVFLGRKWIKNVFSNLMLTQDQPFSLLNNKPILVLAAGDSVESLFPFLFQQAKNFFIVAVDTILPLLAEMAIQPDLIITQDAQLANIHDLIPSIWNKVPLLYDLVSFPSFPRQFSLRMHFCSTFSSLTLLHRLQSISVSLFPALGSVALLACFVALRYSKGPVFLAGLDLSTMTEKTHAKMTAPHRNQLTTQHRLLPYPHLSHHFSQRKTIVYTKKNTTRREIDTTMQNYIYLMEQLDHQRCYHINSDPLSWVTKSISPDQITSLLAQHSLNRAICIPQASAKCTQKFLWGEMKVLETFLENPSSDVLTPGHILDYLLIDFPSSSTYNKSLPWALESAKDFLSHLRRLETKKSLLSDMKPKEK